MLDDAATQEIAMPQPIQTIDHIARTRQHGARIRHQQIKI
jgi:hypothetical protein